MSAHTPWHESIDEEADELYIVNSRGATIAEMIRGINAREEAAGIVKAVNRDHHFDALVKALEEADKALEALGVDRTHRVRWNVIRSALSQASASVGSPST